jgi:hypothetical protein
MLWVENLRLRASGKARSEVLRLFGAFDSEMRKCTGLVSRQLYSRVGIHGDFSILLHWDTAVVPREGSTLAYSLVKAMSTMGMVDHSIWILQMGS